MRNSRLKVWISGRFTGPSHLASLAASTTTEIAKSCSFEPSMAAMSAASRTEGRPNIPPMPRPPPAFAAWPSAAPMTAPSGPPVTNPATPPMILPQRLKPAIPLPDAGLPRRGQGRGGAARIVSLSEALAPATPRANIPARKALGKRHDAHLAPAAPGLRRRGLRARPAPAAGPGGDRRGGRGDGPPRRPAVPRPADVGGRAGRLRPPIRPAQPRPQADRPATRKDGGARADRHLQPRRRRQAAGARR